MSNELTSVTFTNNSEYKNKNFYELLEISKDVSQEEIKKAYRRLAKKYHPDLNVEDTTEMMKAINDAYETLSDVDKRRKYDSKININNQKAYNTYTKTRDESEADLDDWLKDYLKKRRHLNKLYDLYVENEAKNSVMRANFLRPTAIDLMFSEELLKRIKDALADFMGDSLDNPSKILDYLFTEIKFPANAVGYAKREHLEADGKYVIRLALFLNEIKLVIENFGNEKNPNYHSFIEYVLKRYSKVTGIISAYNSGFYNSEPYQELVGSILADVIKANKDYINKLIFKRNS
ncbi:MAG: DnaJ domain-containing protein [Ruminococcus sp.]|nr:DnaJ domain-containing protein [Ruminococcus sp.]